ncbi:MAG: hypothetical protein K1X94_22130 [Sandaracinaceae bacterium]|nr:hypothetical protein [Sandaracinaceae bacterium]
MSDDAFDVWLLDFSRNPDATAALQRSFGVDEGRARRILATLPRVVRHEVSALDAEDVAAALRILGAKVDVRPASPDSKASGIELTRPQRKRAAIRSNDDDDAPPSSPMLEVPSSVELDPDAAVGDPKLGLDAPLAIPEPVRRPAPKPAPKVAPKAAVGASLDPLDPLAEGGGPLELAVEPEAREAPKPITRQGIDADAMKRIEQQREAELDPGAPPQRRGFAIPTIPPRVAAGLVIAVVLGTVAFGLRFLRQSIVDDAPPPAPIVIDDEAHALANGVDVNEFLARPNARLGIDHLRNHALVSQAQSGGAIRVLATNLAEVEGRPVAMTLVIELPSSPLRRRRVAAAIESYRTRRFVDPESVVVPGPDQRYVFLELD